MVNQGANAYYLRTMILGNLPGDIAIEPQKSHYNFGEQVTMTVHPEPGYLFSGWTDAHTENPRTVEIYYDVTYFAVMQQIIAPKWIMKPKSVWIEEGRDLKLYAQAEGTPPLNYTWFFENEVLPNQASENLVLPNIKPDQSGKFTVQASNSAGSSSYEFSVTVYPMGQMKWRIMPDNSFQGFSIELINPVPGKYRVESCSDLIHWVKATEFQIEENPKPMAIPSWILNLKHRFFRIIRLSD